MRVLMSIHHELDPNAGAPGATLQLAAALRARGHTVEVVSFDSIGGAGGGVGRALRFPWAMPGLVSRAAAFDVLDLSSGDGWVLGWWRRLRGAGGAAPLLVARSHGLEHAVDRVTRAEAARGERRLSWRYPLYHGGFRLWECTQAFLRADLCLFLNDSDLAFAVGTLGVAPARARLARNGIAPHFLARARGLLGEAGPARPPPGVAFVGSFIARKGVAVLIEAMVGVMTRHADVTLGCLGGGAASATIAGRFPAALRDRLRVVPRYDNADLPGLLEPYGILAFPSLSEGQALTPMEAQASGLVPVVSDAPGACARVRDGESGIVVPAGDAAALADAIERLLTVPGPWAGMRARALADSATHGWDRVAEETELLYEAGVRARRGQTHRRAEPGAWKAGARKSGAGEPEA